MLLTTLCRLNVMNCKYTRQRHVVHCAAKPIKEPLFINDAEKTTIPHHYRGYVDDLPVYMIHAIAGDAIDINFMIAISKQLSCFLFTQLEGFQHNDNTVAILLDGTLINANDLEHELVGNIEMGLEILRAIKISIDNLYSKNLSHGSIDTYSIFIKCLDTSDQCSSYTYVLTLPENEILASKDNYNKDLNDLASVVYHWLFKDNKYTIVHYDKLLNQLQELQLK